MNRFEPIEGGVAILQRGGVWREAKLYHRGEDVFAATAGGFIKIASNAATSHPKISWHDCEGSGIVTPPGRGPKWKP